MDIPFKVLFKQPKNWNENVETFVSNFVTDERLLYKMKDEELPQIVENKKLTLEFICEDNQARLYMDGLDILPYNTIGKEDDSEIYISPTNGNDVLLYDIENEYNRHLDQHKDGHYPFIPGHYRIRVVVNEISYFSWLKVIPKQITELQWISMRNDIENTLHGLAQDLIRKNESLSMRSDLPIPINMLRKLYALKKDYSKWVELLNAIKDNPRMRIHKEYELMSEGKANKTDSISIRYKARHPESRGYTYSPKNIQSYDLVENQWIRKIVTYIIRITKELLEYLVKHKESVKAEIESERRYRHENHADIRLKLKVMDELDEYEKFVKSVRSKCATFLQTEWMTKVKTTPPIAIPYALQLDYRYKKIYHLYRTLKNEKISISLDSFYDSYWKRTDKLYEIWGFLQVVNALQHNSNGFKVIKGWIFDVKSSNQSVQIPFLEPGTCISFKKGSINLNLIYDGEIPLTEKGTSLNEPIFTNNTHNKPDARIDMYQKNEYIGSIMIDFKYRPLSFIWNHYKLEGRKQSKVMKQLISYQSNMVSSYLYKETSPILGKRIKPVHEVWAVYPKHENNKPVISPLEIYDVRLMELTPQLNQENFYTGMANAIDKVIQSYDELT